MSEYVIEMLNITKRFPGIVANDNITLQLKRGEIHALLGENGAGKSTTMNIMTGYIAATSGEVIIEGHDIFKEAEEAKKHIGYLPEIPPLYMDMTVWEYLFTVADLKGVPKSERKSMIGDVMEKVMITNMKDRLIKNLSKGYKQRVGIAQTLIGNPDIIILDEPTVGLDPKQIIEIRELIRHLGEKHTVILSSHILPEISAVCDHVFIISKGKLVASDSTENLVNLMSGAQEIELTVRTGAGEAAGYLQGEENIARVEQADHDKIRIYAKKGADVREEVFRQMAEHNIPVLEMKTVTKSLEDVFLEITQEGGAQ